MILNIEMIRIKEIIEKKGYYTSTLLDTNKTRNAIEKMLKRNIIVVSEKRKDSIILTKNWI